MKFCTFRSVCCLVSTFRSVHHLASTSPKLLKSFAALLLLAAVLTSAPAGAQVTQLPMWTQQNPASSPPLRRGAVMAYDAAHNQVILFGGSNSSGFLSDTWIWDGTNWTQKFPANSPPPREFAVMAYDAAHGQTVLFGGLGSRTALSKPDLGDTWVWDGTNWTQKFPANSPAPRNRAMVAYDAVHSQVVLFGGEALVTFFGDTWTWDGSNWTLQSPTNLSILRYGGAMAYDAAQSKAILFGGSYLDSPSDTWAWDGSNWTQQFPADSPMPNDHGAMAYDAAHSQVVLFEGYYYNTPHSQVMLNGSQTWIWDGSNWTQSSSSNSPSARNFAAMAYDTAHGQVVLFGGQDPSYGFLNDTWTWQTGALNLGAANVCASGGTTPAPCSQQATLSFQIAANTTVSSISVVTQGDTALDFNPTPSNTSTTLCTPQTYVSTTTCTVDVTFSPKYAGPRSGAVILYGADGEAIATGYIYGTGVAPQVAFLPGTISTVAGDGTGAYGGDGGPATSAELGSPGGVATDAAGNLYIADYDNNRIRRVDANTGTITTVAGSGIQGYSGDGGPGTSAKLNGPNDVAIDGAGNLFIADTNNNVIRKLDRGNGTISTVAGRGFGGYTGDGGPATFAELYLPTGMAIDGAGNLYIADPGNNRIRRVDANTGRIETVAGNGTPGYNGDGRSATSANIDGPYDVSVDGVGNLYIADLGNDRIRKVDASTRTISTVAGNGNAGYSGDGGPATSAALAYPFSVAMDAAGNLYIADTQNNRIRRVDADTGVILTVAGNGTTGFNGDGGPATSAQMSNTEAVAVDGSGNLYIADNHNRIRRVDVGAPPNLTFASVNVGATSAPQTVILQNIGNADLSFPIPPTGNNPSVPANFSLDSTSTGTCPLIGNTSSTPGTLAAGASCTLPVSFTPTAAGSISGSLVLTDTSRNGTAPAYATQSIQLSGVANPGTATHFSASAPPGAMVGTSFNITVTALDAFDNTATGYNGTVHFTSTDAAAILPANLTLANGVGTFGVTLASLGLQTIVVTDTVSSTITSASIAVTVTSAALQVTANNATKVYGMANPIFTGAVTGGRNGENFTESFSTTAVMSSPVGTYTIVPAVTGPNLAAYTQNVTNGILTVTKAGTTTGLSAGSNSIEPGASLTLSAQVNSATTGTPTGTVSFYDGSTLLGTSTLINGVTSYSTTALATASSHTLSAMYGGDANFTGSTTATAVNVVVASLDFNFQATGPLSATVSPGSSATFSYTVAPTSGAYPGPVNFAVSGASAGVSYSLSQTTIAANAGPQTITLTVTSAASTAVVPEPRLWGTGGTTVALGVLFPLGLLRRSGKMTLGAGRRLLVALLVIVASVTALGLSGCGKGVNPNLPRNYDLTVTAASGTVAHTSTVTVLVR